MTRRRKAKPKHDLNKLHSDLLAAEIAFKQMREKWLQAEAKVDVLTRIMEATVYRDTATAKKLLKGLKCPCGGKGPV